MNIKKHKDKTKLRLRKIEERQKAIHTHLRIEPPCSPVASEEEVSEPEAFENPWAQYDEAQATARGTGPSTHAQEIEEKETEEEEDLGGAEERSQDDDDDSSGNRDGDEDYVSSDQISLFQLLFLFW